MNEKLTVELDPENADPAFMETLRTAGYKPKKVERRVTIDVVGVILEDEAFTTYVAAALREHADFIEAQEAPPGDGIDRIGSHRISDGLTVHWKATPALPVGRHG